MSRKRAKPCGGCAVPWGAGHLAASTCKGCTVGVTRRRGLVPHAHVVVPSFEAAIEWASPAAMCPTSAPPYLGSPNSVVCVAGARQGVSGRESREGG
eukprot:390444-Prymnesium_polylepis.1